MELHLTEPEIVQVRIALGAHIEDLQDAIRYISNQTVGSSPTSNLTAIEVLQGCLALAERAMKEIEYAS